MDSSDRTVFLFRADGRLLVRTGAGAVHEASADEHQLAGSALWPLQLGRWTRWGPKG